MKITTTKKAKASFVNATPFGAHFTTKLSNVNSKLICALSNGNTCWDDEEFHCGWGPHICP